MAEFTDSQGEAPNMADLLEYFEARSRSLDDEGHPILDASTLQFISLIRFNGIPILPPVLTQSKREEMQGYKRAAVKLEGRTRAKRRDDMHSKVQSIVAGVEKTYSLKSRSELPRTNGVYRLLERRAANQASKSGRKTSPSGASTKKTSETVTRLTSTKSYSESGKPAPPEIVVNVPVSKYTDKQRSSKTSATSSPSSETSKSKSNYKSLGKLGSLNKQKSYSSQHLDRVSTSLNQSKDETDKTLSPKTRSSRGLLPHPPVGRPPSRGSSMRQSASTPDLRNIDMGVRTEDLKKPLPSRSLSPKGGRPQTQDSPKESPQSKHTGRTRETDSPKSAKTKSDKTQRENGSKESTPVKKDTRTKPDIMKSKGAEAKKVVKDGKSQALHNPLEMLERELVRQEEEENSDKPSSYKGEVRQELDPIQAAAAELFRYPISEEDALATLDSLQADFASLEQMESLPSDYNGIPLTSTKEQQIIHMLTKLSKALNIEGIEDTLLSTTGSNADTVQLKTDYKQAQGDGANNNPRNTNYGANKDGISYAKPQDNTDLCDDGVVDVTNDTSVTGSVTNTSVSSRGRTSPAGSSILSTASSVTASRSRMSPKSLKNTVHFSSFVTEISTSASQSYEDKISIRKLDITPKNSENFEESEGTESKNEGSSRSCLGSGTSATGSLLNKVALSPSIDSSSGSPGQRYGDGSPFDESGNSQDSDLNTSDKENEFAPSVQNSSNESYQNGRSSGRNPHVLNVYSAHIPEGPIGYNHPAVVKSSVKSDTSALKGSQEKVFTEDLAKYSRLLETERFNQVGKMDFDIYTHGTNSSTSSMQDEITRSYQLQHQKPERDMSDGRFGKKKPEISSSSSDGVSMVLQPVLPHNYQNSLNINRSMLEDEEQIRSNLQRVLLEEDSDEENSFEENKTHENIKLTNDGREERLSDQEDNENGVNVNLVNPGQHVELLPISKPYSELEAQEDKEADTADTELDVHVEGVTDDDETDNYEITVDEVVEDNEITVDEIGEDDETDNAEEIVEAQEMDNADEVVTVNEVDEKQNEIKVTNTQPDVEEAEDQNEEEEEEQGKAEQIQKYLNHVHEQSMQIEEEPDPSEPDDAKNDGNFDIASLIQSFTSTLQSMNHLSQEDLFRIQAEQFELLQKRLIEQQRAQLEELFVAQRREQFALEKEIETYQADIQDTIDTIPLPDTHRARISGGSIPYTGQAWPLSNQLQAPNIPLPNPAMSPPFAIQPVRTMPYPQDMNGSIVSHNTSYSTIPYSDIHAVIPFQHPQGQMFQGHHYPDPNLSQYGQGHRPGTMPPPSNPNVPKAQNKHSREEGPHRLKKKKTTESSVAQKNNPYIYPPSPSLCRNPADRDDESDVSGFVQATPKQLIFSNHSTPVPVPKVSTHRPVMHSPAKRPSQAWNGGKFVIPEKVFDPSMKGKFDRVSAAVKGYLTRRLLKTRKVQEIVKTIDDTRNFAFSFQAETPIKHGTFTREDRDLLERIVAQLQAALLDIHEIFFETPVSERMAIISMSRMKERELKERESYLGDTRKSSMSVTQSQPKLSKATLKALERKKKAQIAEESIFGSTEFRPKSAPPHTSSPQRSTDIRALRPIQGQISPITSDTQITVREMKERPKSASDKGRVKTAGTNNKVKKVSGTKSTKTATAPTQSNRQTKTSSAQLVNTKSKKMDKAWR